MNLRSIFRLEAEHWLKDCWWSQVLHLSFLGLWFDSTVYIYDYTVLSMSIELFLRKFVFLYIFMSEVNPPFLWYQPPKNLQLYCLLQKHLKIINCHVPLQIVTPPNHTDQDWNTWIQTTWGYLQISFIFSGQIACFQKKNIQRLFPS